jgi:hypothetical protein
LGEKAFLSILSPRSKAELNVLNDKKFIPILNLSGYHYSSEYPTLQAEKAIDSDGR